MSTVNWHKLTVNSAQVAAGEIQRCKDTFDQYFSAARALRAMAIFQQARPYVCGVGPRQLDDMRQLKGISGPVFGLRAAFLTVKKGY